MIAKLTEVWEYMNTPHTPAVLLVPSAKPAAGTPFCSNVLINLITCVRDVELKAAAKETAEAERKEDERITEKLKSLPIYTKILQYQVRSQTKKKNQSIYDHLIMYTYYHNKAKPPPHTSIGGGREGAQN